MPLKSSEPRMILRRRPTLAALLVLVTLSRAIAADSLAPVEVYRRDITALAVSASAGFEGPAVFLGYGVRSPDHRYDSYAGAEVKGKVAIVFRYEPQDGAGKSRWADGDEKTRGWTPASFLTAKAGWA